MIAVWESVWIRSGAPYLEMTSIISFSLLLDLEGETPLSISKSLQQPGCTSEQT